MTERYLEKLRPLVRIMAAERTQDRPELYEDCIQEGMIAAWRALADHPDKPAAYYQVAARWSMLKLLNGQPAYGSEGRRGWQDAHDSSGPLVMQGSGDEGAFTTDKPDPVAARMLEAVETRDAAVLSAVEALPMRDRVLVFLRFWEGRTGADIAEAIGVKEGTVAWRWSQVVRPGLRESLAGFADAY